MSVRLTESDNPCVRCGACCATYRVSFYWAEADECGLPAHLTTRINDWYSCMAGTGGPSPRCAALSGEIGRAVACTVYDRRTSPCRELQAGDDKCNRARARHGLPPLSPMRAAEYERLPAAA